MPRGLEQNHYPGSERRTIFDSATNQFTLTGVISGPGVPEQDGDRHPFSAGNNSYSGGTLLSEGTINIVQDANFGNPAGSLTLKGGTLQAGADLSSSPAHSIPEEVPSITGAIGELRIRHRASITLLFSGTVTGPGYLTQTGQGSLTLNGNGSGYTGQLYPGKRHPDP